MSLVYGLFIEQLNRDDFEIISYKDPAFIKPVNYKELLQRFFNTHISDDEHEDIYLKKLIANVIIGLLEKGISKACKSIVFDTIDETQHYQAKYGGHLSILRKYEEVKKNKDDDDFDEDRFVLLMLNTQKQTITIIF